MANKMLIDAAHPEETRVVVLRGNRVEEFDYESASKKQLRGNIYLAKVTRVEPSLQAAFVDYGGNRHGFLAFNEIHPDYYQIPVADRLLLKEEEEREAAEQRAFEARQDAVGRRRHGNDLVEYISERDGIDFLQGKQVSDVLPVADDATADEGEESDEDRSSVSKSDDRDELEDDDFDEGTSDEVTEVGGDMRLWDSHADEAAEDGEDEHRREGGSGTNGKNAHRTEPEVFGSEDALEELPSRPKRRRRKIYKIQEVIRRGQIILVQVVKEERGNKGAALTTYLSLAGRYTVLMPNTARGGGISRKIANIKDRKRLREIADAIEVPDGTGVIVRTAGASRTKTEIKRDFDYLLRLWENIRQFTLASTAPTLIYEEGNLIKRSIRDLYSKEIDEVLVVGDDAYREAKDFMRLIMPSHTKSVQHYRDQEPLFNRYQIERQLNAMFNPQVKLKSGGYIVINQTEALVAIDVNSGKATREFSIEETALATNLEAAEEVARQLRLRDLAGLIVIDFIDMDERRNNRAVELMLKNCLKTDRSRIQVGHISPFGLLEMSRQRLRTGVLEGSTSQCPHCQGTGIVRSTESVALFVLRSIEDTLMSSPKSNLSVRTTPEAALYILNYKRNYLREIELHYGVSIIIEADTALQGTGIAIEKIATPLPVQITAAASESKAVSIDWAYQNGEGAVESDDAEETEEAEEVEERDDEENGEAAAITPDGENGKSEEGRRVRSRRSRRRGRKGEAEDEATAPAVDASEAEADGEKGEDDGEQRPRRSRRRGRRGGRGRDRERGQDEQGTTTGHVINTDSLVEIIYADEPAPVTLVTEVRTARSNTPEPRDEGASSPTSKAKSSAPARSVERPAALSAVGFVEKDLPLVTMPPLAFALPEAPRTSAEPADNTPKKRGWWQKK